MMKVWICALVFLGLGACEQKSAPAPAATAQAEQPLAPTPSEPDVPQVQHPLVHQAPAAAAATDAAPNSLVVVQERNQVCMVNDQYMGREQIPVTIAEKTYYGCCPMCQGRLERDPGARAAKDPVSGSVVDKATAVIGRAPSGQVFYFENEDTLRQYKL
jgi:YHS domain-containing protein